MTNELHPFTDSDWDGFAGAEEFSDGSPPQIGETDKFAIIASGVGTHADVEIYFADGSMFTNTFMTKSEALAAATLLLNASLTPAALVAFGFDRRY